MILLLQNTYSRAVQRTGPIWVVGHPQWNVHTAHDCVVALPAEVSYHQEVHSPGIIYL